MIWFRIVRLVSEEDLNILLVKVIIYLYKRLRDVIIIEYIKFCKYIWKKKF